LGKNCAKDKSVKPCHYGGLLKNLSSDHQIESIYYFGKGFKNLHKSIVPWSVCPYRPKTEDPDFDYFWCPDLDKALEKNPIEYTIKGMETVYDVKSAKELLFKKKRPLGIGAPLPTLFFYTPCEDYPNSTHCKHETFVCPDDPTKYCHRHSIDARQRDGIFLTRSELGFVGELGGHAMNVVGYNDDWIYRNRFQNSDHAKLRGGLILHNSWAAPGHSVDYLMGKRSEENENLICPNHHLPMTWIPATLECAKQNPKDLSKCSTDIQRVRGDRKLAQGADALLCSDDKVCDPAKRYVLRRLSQAEGLSEKGDADVQHMPNGLDISTFIEIDRETDETKLVTYKHLPFWTLRNIFKPEFLVENHPQDCGYWMYPYDSLENMYRINWDNFDNLKFSDIEFEFKEQSFAANEKKYPHLDYKYIKESTWKYDRPTFDGALPFDRVY
jgi:hypothetical protein